MIINSLHVKFYVSLPIEPSIHDKLKDPHEYVY